MQTVEQDLTKPEEHCSASEQLCESVHHRFLVTKFGRPFRKVLALSGE